MENMLTYLFVTFWMFLGLIKYSISSDNLLSNKNSANNVVVVFDPYVSILDKYNLFRYNQTDLLPLIETVSTKFQRVCVQLSQYDMDEETSLSLVPEAVAHFNQVNVSESVKMEVWMQYVGSINEFDYEDSASYPKNPLILIDQLNSLAGKSNQIWDDTVTTILLPYKLSSAFTKVLQNINSTLKASFTNVKKWGFVVDYDTMISDSNIFEDFELLNPDVVLCSLLPFANEDQFLSRMQRLAPYRKRFAGRSLFGYILTIPDTDTDGKSNITSTVSIWNLAMNSSETAMISKAFDTPYEDSVEQKTSGWWRLSEDPSYKSTAEYKFIKKSDLIVQPKTNDTEKELRRPPTKLNVSRDHVGVILNLFDRNRTRTNNRLPNEDRDELYDKIAAIFKKVVVLIHDVSPNNGRKVFRDESRVCCYKPSIKYNLDITFLFLPGIHLSDLYKDISLTNKEFISSPLIAFMANQYFEAVKAYVFPYVGNETDKDVNYFHNNFQPILKSVNIANYSFGYTFNISLCSSFDKLSTYDKEHFDRHMSEPDVKRIVIFFEESEDNAKLGPERIFNQTIVLFAECQKILAERINITEDLQISFMLLHYGTSSNFYESDSNIINYIEYLQKLSDWAKHENTTVILNNVIDTDRWFETRGRYMREVGWWKYQYGDVSERIPSPTSASNAFINKIEYLEWRSRNQATITKRKYPLVLAIVMPVITVVFFVVVTTIVWIRRANRDNVLTKAEVKNFFKGGMHNNPLENDSNIFSKPYNKDHYELTPEQFTISEEIPLGSGEFSNVYRGKIVRMDTGAKYVATRVMKSNNIMKKVGINKLLLEIKVLSYLGKHENIVELLGAYTQNVRIGKVYIFLEICELGSLDKYLQKMRPPAEKTPTSVNTMMAMTENSLNDSLVEDLFLWSREICNGMVYLVSKNVYPDIATRNVLLNGQKVAKICDFGLSRKLEPLSWKWMSPQALQLKEFNEKNVVWAYGVTLWEIYTLGDEPYPGTTFEDMLLDGMRLPEPKYNDENNMYNVMQQCWHANPQSRPTFAELLQSF